MFQSKIMILPPKTIKFNLSRKQNLLCQWQYILTPEIDIGHHCKYFIKVKHLPSLSLNDTQYQVLTLNPSYLHYLILAAPPAAPPPPNYQFQRYSWGALSPFLQNKIISNSLRYYEGTNVSSFYDKCLILDDVCHSFLQLGNIRQKW